jgi:protein SCO1/2
MNDRKPLLVFLGIVIGSVLIVGSMWLFFFRMEMRKTTLPVFGHVPDFALTERSGRTIRLGDLLGTVWIADFIFTRCTAACPMMSSHMKQLQNVLGSSQDVRLVSITVDPERDTPEVLSNYASRYGAHQDRWFFLTGEKDRIQALAVKGFFLGTDSANPKETILHSQKIVLVDRRGRIRGYYDGESPGVTMSLLRAVASLQQERR